MQDESDKPEFQVAQHLWKNSEKVGAVHPMKEVR